MLWSIICIFLTSDRIGKSANLLDIGKFDDKKSIPIWYLNENVLILDIWGHIGPQIATKYIVKFQFRMGQIFLSPEKCKLYFLG